VIVERSSDRTRLIIGFVITVLVALPAFVPDTGAPSGTDGPLHVLAGALLVGTYAVLLQTDSAPDRWAVWGSALLIAVTVGVCVEVGQSWIPGRQPSTLDVLAHALGSILGLVLVAVWARRRSP
jgi:hypothetical protein